MTIRKSVRVARPPAVAFRVFCEEIGVWWPEGFSGPGSKLTLEGRVGGRFYETSADGKEYEIGRVTAYRAPQLVAFTWRAPSWEYTTQVEIRFLADGEGTRVELEHSGWDQADKLRDAGKGYDTGWDQILGLYISYMKS